MIQDLERARATEGAVRRLEDLAHTTGTQARLDGVLTELRAGNARLEQPLVIQAGENPALEVRLP